MTFFTISDESRVLICEVHSIRRLVHGKERSISAWVLSTALHA